MATEVGEKTYRPLIIGTWRWDEEIGAAGGWSFELEHELLLVGPHDAATAIVLPEGLMLHYSSEQCLPTVITGLAWMPTPPTHVVEEIALAGEILDRLNKEAEAMRESLLQVLPI